MTRRWQHWGKKRLTKAKKNRRKEGGGEKIVKTEANVEVRDEKGKTLFSFHVIKYLLYLHRSPTDDHSCLKKKKKSAQLGAGMPYNPIGSSHLYYGIQQHCTQQTDTCTTLATARDWQETWKIWGEEKQTLNSHACVRTSLCVKEREVKVKIFKAFQVHCSVMSLGRKLSTCSQANPYLPLTSSPPQTFLFSPFCFSSPHSSFT